MLKEEKQVVLWLALALSAQARPEQVMFAGAAVSLGNGIGEWEEKLGDPSFLVDADGRSPVNGNEPHPSPHQSSTALKGHCRVICLTHTHTYRCSYMEVRSVQQTDAGFRRQHPHHPSLPIIPTCHLLSMPPTSHHHFAILSTRTLAQ